MKAIKIAVADPAQPNGHNHHAINEPWTSLGYLRDDLRELRALLNLARDFADSSGCAVVRDRISTAQLVTARACARLGVE